MHVFQATAPPCTGTMLGGVWNRGRPSCCGTQILVASGGLVVESYQGRSLVVMCDRENQQLVERAKGMEIKAFGQGGLFRS